MAFVDLNDALIAQVRGAADIVDVISQHTPLKQAGKSHKGLCPFHREKTPSFHVDRDKGFFYCFGCGTGGDVFKFVMLTERFSFPEAVEYVASRAGITLPRRKEKASESGKENLLEAVEEAAAAFHQALGWTPNAAESYLQKREIDPELWRKYGFGYAPDSWDYILKRLGRKFQPKQLESAGLVLPRKSGDGYYDRFRNRLIVPIHSEGGSIVGFGGRTLDGSDPKYLNSPESDVFNKSRLLYNLHRGRDAMRRLDRAILVEGYFDCIALDNAGVDGVVASMGTSLTTGQAAMIRRLARRVIVAYDGDEAGRGATLRAAPILLSAGLEVDVVDVGPGEDPDTFLRKNGLDAVIELLANANDVFEFALGRVAPNPSGMRGAEK
ncbi:MAG TPA: DNA primase, partial [Thermoanaerobaculia bacterium]|nr:DNA primase [Thermoanaerobaculia bacterium]